MQKCKKQLEKYILKNAGSVERVGTSAEKACKKCFLLLLYKSQKNK